MATPAGACPDHERLGRLEERVYGLDRFVQEQILARDRAQAKLADALGEFKKASDEWRGALNDLGMTRLSVAEYNARHAALEEKIDAAAQRAEDRGLAHAATDDRRFEEQGRAIEEIRAAVVEMQGKSHGIEASRVWLFAIVGAVVALAGAAIGFARL